MRSEAHILKGGDAFVEVPDLRTPAGAGAVEVRAHGKSLMAFNGGVVMTTFGGIGVAAGAVLLPVGLGLGRDDLTVAGAITLPLSGALLLAPGIWLIAQSAAKAEVTGPGGPSDARRAPRRGLALGGTF
jgi:hypothetical protein